MQHLQSFSLFEAQETSDLTQKQKTFLTRYTQGTWSVNSQTGLVDVEGNFDCRRRRLKSLLGISFGHVSGYFYCSYNPLTSLEGAPQTVGGTFLCAYNQLISLVGAPQTVGGDFWCHQNQLTSLAGAPQTVGGGFYCDSFTLQRGEWNPLGWTKILATGDSKARSLIVTLPQIKPDFWLELYRTKRKNFYDLWLTYRQDPQIRKTELFQQVESSLPGQAKSSLEDLEDLRDLGI